MATDLTYDLILGTAGHIDHGKTSLIKALTGIDTDRLPEEKKRGITIELGYAHLELPPFRLGIVDVPGHEKFVRQMLAGATGMDLVMLIVAADDSIKPQTYEHLDILRLLDLSSGLIVLTKSDLVEPDWLDLVELEVRQLVEGTFLEQAPIVRTSVKSGTGIEELKTALFHACQARVAQLTRDQELPVQAPFRMAIDRAFSIAGHGTIVTGSVVSGRAQIGDQLEIMPVKLTARIRGLQNHDAAVETIHAGQRAAINLAGIPLQDIERGHELATIGSLKPVKRLLVRLQILERASRTLPTRSRVRFHLGTTELMATVRWLDSAAELEPGQSGFALLTLAEDCVASWGQPFVIRQPSPMETLGGGIVIHPSPVLLKRASDVELSLLSELAGEDEQKRAAAAIYFSDQPAIDAASLWRMTDIPQADKVLQILREQGELLESRSNSGPSLIAHRLRIEAISQRVLTVLSRLHQKYPLRFAHPRQELANQFAYLEHPHWLDAAIDTLKGQQQVTANVNSISLVGSGPKLSKGQKQLMEQLIDQFKTKGLSAPSVSELQAAAVKNKDSVRELLELAAENGALAKISDDLFLHADTVAEVQQRLVRALSGGVAMTTSEIRQALETTRKYAIPLLEYFDAQGFTHREGDLRKLASETKVGS